MAFLQQSTPSFSLYLFLFLFLSNIHLLSLSLSTTNPTTADIHDLLPEYGFPKGLIPDAVESYTISSDGSFVVNLDRSCYVHFDDELVYYDKLVKGKMSYGSVTDVSGIQAKKLFFLSPFLIVRTRRGCESLLLNQSKVQTKLIIHSPCCAFNFIHLWEVQAHKFV
ncbi:hypothetical protein Vadar_010153 [Vaccinium darrowii]|uniref:Uncharacterized protein n=1 Tax=Vaccinium darrowii TaxID=229202 RepID=A0ACB7X900_9ERIC|nr:hypothetical protein Vadar_010153 [Vaccinium darrowii]